MEEVYCIVYKGQWFFLIYSKQVDVRGAYNYVSWALNRVLGVWIGTLGLNLCNFDCVWS